MKFTEEDLEYIVAALAIYADIEDENGHDEEAYKTRALIDRVNKWEDDS